MSTTQNDFSCTDNSKNNKWHFSKLKGISRMDEPKCGNNII